MKKNIAKVLSLALAVSAAASLLPASLAGAEEDKVIRVAASSIPHAEILEQAKALAAEIAEKSVTVSIKVGEGGKTFGSVSSKEIAEAAKAQINLELDKKKIQLSSPIRTLGVTMVPVKLHPKVTAELKVHVKEA